MLIITSDPHSFAMCCSETLFVITLQWASVVGSRWSGHYEAHKSFGLGTSTTQEECTIKPFESYCSLHCTFVISSKMQRQVNSMFPLMRAMICWEKMKTPIRKSRLM